MAEIDMDSNEADVTESAVQALNIATRRAIHSGLPILVVIDSTLVRLDLSGMTVVRKLPPRRKVATRLKRASK